MPPVKTALPLGRADDDALAEIIAPVSAGAFFRRYLGKSFLHVPGQPLKYSGLISWRALNHILSYQTLWTRIRMAKDGQIMQPSAYTSLRASNTGSLPLLSVPALTDQLRAGSTLIIDGLDELHPPLADFAGRLERAFHSRVQVNLYASWRSSPAFDTHWDDHDTLILQVAGRKRWQVYRPTTAHPLPHYDHSSGRAKGAPAWDSALTAGDALYLPRGFWHVAIPCDEPTLHLTVGVTHPTGYAFLRWLVERSASSRERLRADLLWRWARKCGSGTRAP